MGHYRESIAEQYLGNTKSVARFTLSASNLAKVSFFVYLFFIFFGTSIPFQEKITDVEDIRTSNLISQIVYSSLYIMSFISLLSKRHLIIRFVKTEKYLSLFLLWSFLTVFWSDFPLVSFKRWIQIAGAAIIFLSALLHFRSADEAMRYLRAILIVYISFTVLSIMFIPGAIDWRFPAWRGLAAHKNILGQISIVSLMVWAYAAWDRVSGNRVVALVFSVLSFILLIGSRSSTAIVTGVFIFVLAGLWIAAKEVAVPVVGRLFSSVFICSFVLGVFSILYLSLEIQVFAMDLIGKELTLTGRVDLWKSVYEETRRHFLFGSGYGGFWNVDSPVRDVLYEEFVWLPGQSHLGYLDVLNETGAVGIGLLTFMVISYFKNVYAYEQHGFFAWLVIAVLVINLSESTLFRTNHVTGVLFTFCYVGLYADLVGGKALAGT